MCRVPEADQRKVRASVDAARLPCHVSASRARKLLVELATVSGMIERPVCCSCRSDDSQQRVA